MIQVKCIKKFRDKHNKIIGYRLVDTNGNMQDVKAEKLKEVLSTGKLSIVNLTLTKDGRLVNTSENDTKSGVVNNTRKVIHQPKPQPEQTNIIIKDHQPILFCGLIKRLDLGGTETLRFKVVDSLSNILNKVKVLGDGVDVDKITDDMYMIYNINNKTATIASEAPVRVLAEESFTLGRLFKTIDFKNADLSHIKSLDDVVGKASSTEVVQHSLDEIKRINHSIVSRYKYKKPDPFNNKEADKGLDVANALCSIWTWAWVDDLDVDMVFNNFTSNACNSIEKVYGLCGLGRQDTTYILDLLELNWDAFKSVDNVSDIAATWAISRVLATHDLMSHLDKIVKNYNDPIFYAITNKNIELAMDGDILKDSVLSAFGYDIEGTYDEFMHILREKIYDYDSQKFLRNLETCIKYFKSTGDTKALKHFSEFYKCVSGIINEVNNMAKDKKKVIEDNLKQIDNLLGEKLNVNIKTQKSSNDFGMLHYEAITDKLFTGDDKVAEVLDLDDDLIGANVCIFATIKYNVIGEGFEEDEDTLLEIVVESSEKADSTTLIGHTSTEYYSIISFDDLQNSIDELKEGYNQLMEELGVKKT